MRPTLTRISVVALFIALMITHGHAAPPQLVNYQGEVTDGGLPVSDGNYAMEFRIFSVAAGGVALWSEVVPNVAVSNGRFNILLGQVTALPEDVFDGTERWLESVFDGQVLAPRVRFVTVAYAHRISTVDGATGGSITGGVEINFTDIAWALDVQNNGLGGGGHFVNNMPANSEAAVTAVHIGGAPGGRFASEGGNGVEGTSNGAGYGLYGSSAFGTPIYGEASGTADSSKAIHGVLNSATPGQYSAAIRGQSLGFTGNGIGVWGSHPALGWGVYGTSWSGRGVYGHAIDGEGIRGFSESGTGVFGITTSGTGIYGENNSNLGSKYAIHGVLDNTTAGGSSAGVRGENRGTTGSGIGVYGSQDGSGWGVYGTVAGAGRGVYGFSPTGTGLYGSSTDGAGIRGTSTNGVAGQFTGSRVEVLGGSDVSSTSTTDGYLLIGSGTGVNIAIDNNEIIARDNGATSLLHLQADGGQVGIGLQGLTVPAGFIFAVDGKAMMEEVEVQLSGDWPDYVFEENYDLLPLSELERHIKSHRHLPGIPSQADMDGAGLAIGEMQTKLLEKVEELTLYILQLNDRIDRSETEKEALRKRVEFLERSTAGGDDDASAN